MGTAGLEPDIAIGRVRSRICKFFLVKISTTKNYKTHYKIVLVGLGPESARLFYNNDRHDGYHHGDQTIAMVNFLARWNGQCFLYSKVFFSGR